MRVKAARKMLVKLAPELQNDLPLPKITFVGALKNVFYKRFFSVVSHLDTFNFFVLMN